MEEAATCWAAEDEDAVLKRGEVKEGIFGFR